MRPSTWPGNALRARRSPPRQRRRSQNGARRSRGCRLTAAIAAASGPLASTAPRPCRMSPSRRTSICAGDCVDVADERDRLRPIAPCRRPRCPRRRRRRRTRHAGAARPATTPQLPPRRSALGTESIAVSSSRHQHGVHSSDRHVSPRRRPVRRGATRRNVVGDASRNIDAGDVDRVLELHGGIDLADQEPVAILEQVDGKHTAARQRQRRPQ